MIAACRRGLAVAFAGVMLGGVTGAGAQGEATSDGADVRWGPLPSGWTAYRVEGQSTTVVASEASGDLGTHRFVMQSAQPGGWRAVAEIRLSTKDIRTLDQFAAEFAGPGLQRQFEAAAFNGQPAFHSQNTGRTATFHDWLVQVRVRGGQPWIATQISCAFSPGRPGYEQCDARRAELERILATIHFAAAPPARLTARILLPPDLKPGDVISPSAAIVDADGRPPRGEITEVWFIGGAQRNSVTWDGTPLRIELQATADGQPLTAELALPAFGTAPAVMPTPPEAPGVPAVVPGLSGIGDLPGPRNTTEGLVGTLGPAAIGLLGALLSGLLNVPSPPPPVLSPPPSVKPKRPRKGVRDEGDDGGDADDDQEGTDGDRGDDEDDDSKVGKSSRKRDDDTPGKADEKRETPRTTRGRHRDKPSEPKPPEPGDHIRSRLEQLRKVADRAGSQELRDAIDKAVALGFGLDGKLDPEAWKAAQKDLWAARDRAFKNVEAPNSWLRDVVGVGAGAVGSGFMQGARAAGSMIGGLGHLALNGYSGAKAIGDALLHPATFARGASHAIGEWADKNATTEKQGFTDGMRDGRIGDALVYLGMGAVKAGAQAGDKALGFVKREILPWEELKSLADSKASLEEKLWAVPAAAAKVAGLLTMGQSPTTQPATRWGNALHNALDRHAARGLAQTAEAAAGRVSQLEAQAAALERAAAGRSGAGVQSVLDSTRKALDKARTAQQTAQAAHEVEMLSKQAMRAQPALENFQQAQRALKDNPTLTKAIDDALVKNNGGGSLYDLRARGALSQDAHTLMTARKLQLQEQALNNATKRIIEKEVQALQQAGKLKRIPRRYDTFNATQGSRSRISGSNVNADLDQTVIGLKNVSREQAEQIVQEECRKLGMTQPQLDVNVYRPGKGLMDARGAAPNAQTTLENIGQTTGTAGHHPVYVDRSGKVHVGNHVTTPQGREGVLAGRRTMDPPPGMSRKQWRNEGVWEGHQGAPVQVPKSQWPAVRQTQVEGLHHAFERGDMNQMVKYANRGRSVGLAMDESTAQLVRAVAGQKDPALAAQMLRNAGIHSPAELMQRLGVAP